MVSFLTKDPSGVGFVKFSGIKYTHRSIREYKLNFVWKFLWPKTQNTIPESLGRPF